MHNKMIDKIYLQIDRIAIKGNINYLEYYKYIDDCILNGNYDNLLQCLFFYYQVDLRKIKVANDVKNCWSTILSITLSSFDKRMKKLYTNKNVYQLGQKVFDASNIVISPDGTTYPLGEIIEHEIFTPEYKYYLKNKEFAKITKTVQTNLTVNRIDGEVLILDAYNSSTSYDTNLYNKYAQAITFLLDAVMPNVILPLPTFYLSSYGDETFFNSIDTNGNLIPFELFKTNLEGTTLVANNYDDNLTYFINDNLNGDFIFGQINTDGSIESLLLDLPDGDYKIGLGNSFYYEGNDSFIYCLGGYLSNNGAQTVFRINMSGSVELINTNFDNVVMNNIFKVDNTNYTLSIIEIGNSVVNIINIAEKPGDTPTAEDIDYNNINVLTTVNNVPDVNMYKILLILSSVVYNDKVYCQYYLVNKETNAPVVCIAELNLETYEAEWVRTVSFEDIMIYGTPLQLIANL